MEDLITVGALLAAVAGVAWGVLRGRAARSPFADAPVDGPGALVFEHANDAIYLVRPDGSIADGNERAATLYGLTREELRSRRLVDLRAPDDQCEQHISAQMAQVMAAGGGVFECMYRRGDGTTFPVEVSTRLAHGPGGPLFVSIARDVSERRRAEAELRGSEQRQATILRSLPLAVYTATVGQAIDATWISESISRLTGFPPERFLTEPNFWSSRLHPEDRDRVLASMASIRETQAADTVYRWQVADASYRWFLDQAILSRDRGNSSEIIGTMFDITAQKQAEQALRDSEQRYRTLLENIHDMVVEYDGDCRVVYVSPHYEFLVGYEPTAAVGGHVCENIHEDDCDQVVAELSRAWARGFGHLVYRLHHKSGEWRWFEAFARTYQTPAGARQGVMLARDITQSKLSEEALRQSEARTRAILSALPDLVFQIDRSGTFIAASAPDEARLLSPPSLFLGHTVEEVLPPGLAATTRERLEAALATRETQSYDYDLPFSGATRWFEARMVPFGSDAVVAVVRDITERKAAENALRDSEVKYKSLTEQLPVGIYRTNPTGQVLHANTALATIFGYESAAELVRDCDVRTSFADPSERLRLLAQWKQRGGITREELLLLRKDGSPIWVRDSGRLFFDAAGEIEHIDGVIEDITDRKQAEEAMRSSEARYRQIFEGTLAVQLLIDPATATIVDANPAACEFYRYAAEQLKGLPLDTLDTRSRIGLPEELQYLAAQAATTFQTEHRLASGELREVEVHLSPVEISGKPFLYAVVHDITRRQRAEAERDRVIRLLQTTAGIASHFLTTPDPRKAAAKVVESLGKAAGIDRCYWFEGFTDERGRLMVRMMGEWCRPGIPAVSGHPTLQALPTANFPRFLRALQGGEVIAGMVADFSAEEQALFALGGTQAVVVAPIIVRGTAAGFLGFDLCTNPRVWQTDEIHLMHAAANAFAMALERWEQQQQREELANVVEQASEAVIITDRQWRIRYVNPAYTRITGFSREESLGLRPRMFMLKDPPSPLPSEAQEGPERGDGWTGIIESWRKDHTVLQTQSTIYPMRGNTGEIVGFASIHVDITNQVRLEGQLVRAQKMEALGQFASGIAHDFNNLITVIQGTAELLLRRGGDHSLREELTTIRRTAQRSTELTSALLAFARRQVLRREDLDLNAAIGEALPMLRRVLPENITLRYTPASPTSGVHADLGQLEQVLMNLVANARDAMPGGGTLTLATENVRLGADYVETHPWAQAGAYVKLSVTDTGTGMDEATLTRIFEPFFSTKEPGKGTGLGLSSVFGIVKQHGGMIDVYSVPGVGSTFNVYLPLLEREVGTEISHPEVPAIQGGHERILVVEDQGDLRKVLTSILQDLGYTVRTARDGVEALAALAEVGGELDLVISDMVMPRLDGLELLRRCRESYPLLAFLLQSGYSEAGAAGDITESARVGFISKPYSIELLAYRVRSLLDAPVSSA